MKNGLFLFLFPLCLLSGDLTAQPVGTLDLADVTPSDGVYRRVLGSVGVGASGVPVAGGHDVDGDGHADYAMAAQRAGVYAVDDEAGQIFLVFGDGQINGQIDTLDNPDNILRIRGHQKKENAGSEIWMADVTGDGLGDLIICRQNHSTGGTRIGAGALTLLPGGSALRDLASNGATLDLGNPPAGLPIVTIHGPGNYSRLCIWARTGDITGDGIDDLVVAADQEADGVNAHSGAVYVIRGGDHLATGKTIDLANFGSVEPGNIARIRTPANSAHYHLGATLQVADLDNNGKAEVMAAAALNRAGAGLQPDGGGNNDTHGSGGTPTGTLFITWDDNFPESWIPAPDFRIGQGTGSTTTLIGGSKNDAFGEEILGGRDYDNNGAADLFVGDLTADGWGDVFNGNNAGTGHVIYDIANWKNHTITVDAPPVGFNMSTFVGPAPSAITGDTAMHGDFNGDGIDDLAFSSPKDSPLTIDKPLGRKNAGTLHIVLGQNGKFPTLSDLKPENFPSSGVAIFEIYGAKGNADGFVGDVLCYSGAEGDINGDGITDLIINEMQGDGSVLKDVGNLLVIDNAVLFQDDRVFADGFEGPE